jgi:hypothetical protein
MLVTGIAIGALSLVTFGLLRRKAWHRRHGFKGRGCGHGFHGRHGLHGYDHEGRFGDGHEFGWLNHLTRRIDATPEQSEVIRKEAEEVFAALRELRSEGLDSRDEIARILREQSFDEERLGEMFARHDDRLRTVRLRLAGALAKIHQVLNERQREQLARFLGGGWGGFRSPYRGRGGFA